MPRTAWPGSPLGRIRRLERELRIYRLAIFASLAGVLTMFLPGACEGAAATSAR